MAIPPRLELEGGGHVEYRPIDAKMFLNKSTNLYGGSGTGKTVILREILSGLQSKIDDFYVFCGTLGVSDDAFFSPSNVPRHMLFSELKMPQVRQIFFLQEFRIKLAECAGDPEYLAELAEANNPGCLRGDLQEALARYRTAKSTVSIERVKDVSKRLCQQIGAIIENNLHPERLTLEQQSVAKVIGVPVPNVGIIFDDLGGEISKLTGEDLVLLTNLYTKGRHFRITFFVLLQDVMFLKVALRNNGMINIFTDGTSSTRFFENKASGGKELALKAKRVSLQVHAIAEKHYVMVYVKSTPQPFSFTKSRAPAELPVIKLCCDRHWRVARLLASKSRSIMLDPKNPLSALFK
jgi:hypothetical protein